MDRSRSSFASLVVVVDITIVLVVLLVVLLVAVVVSVVADDFTSRPSELYVVESINPLDHIFPPLHASILVVVVISKLFPQFLFRRFRAVARRLVAFSYLILKMTAVSSLAP